LISLEWAGFKVDVKTVITARLAFTPLEAIHDAVVVVDDGHIVSVSSRSASPIPENTRIHDFPDAILAPGFIDIHVHGGAGHDVMQPGDDGLSRMEQHFAKHGVTSYCPTTVTAPLDATFAALDRLAVSHKAPRTARAKPVGLHLEGPFISHAKRGVHPPDLLLAPSLEVFDKIWQAAQGTVAMMTIAPELPGAVEMIREAASRGVCISLGHSDATLAQTQAGVEAGGRHATHTFNAMRPLDHREPGILGDVLSDPRITADVIADGVHVHPEVLKIFLRAKGPEGAVLITDAMSATGMGDGRFRLGGFEVEVRGDRCEHEGKLAGSVLTLDRAVRNITTFASWSLQDAVRLATLNPARVLGRNDIGILAPGAQADFILLSPDGTVQRTIIDGQVA
jgi:N-acetylglucosamine-6-phosphate deacetylase